jgi:integrase
LNLSSRCSVTRRVVQPVSQSLSRQDGLTLEEEKKRLLKTAVMRPEWETAYLAAILCLNTTARGCELKGLQWSDVDLFAKTLTIRKSKTAAGERVQVQCKEGD